MGLFELIVVQVLQCWDTKTKVVFPGCGVMAPEMEDFAILAPLAYPRIG